MKIDFKKLLGLAVMYGPTVLAIVKDVKGTVKPKPAA
jgi:hypothetical protein